MITDHVTLSQSDRVNPVMHLHDCTLKSGSQYFACVMLRPEVWLYKLIWTHIVMQCNAGIDILALQHTFTLTSGRNAVQAKYCEPIASMQKLLLHT